MKSLKKMQKTIGVLVCMLLAVTITSCGKRNLVGTWKRDMNLGLQTVQEVWRFGEDGSFSNIWECDESQYHYWEYPKIMATGNYRAFGGKITLNYSGVKEKWSYSLSNSNKELRIGKDASGYKTFQRAY